MAKKQENYEGNLNEAGMSFMLFTKENEKEKDMNAKSYAEFDFDLQLFADKDLVNIPLSDLYIDRDAVNKKSKKATKKTQKSKNKIEKLDNDDISIE